MTAVMQSSTVSIAVTLSAYHAGAIGVDQGCTPIIGQNIGTATSSAMAAIGASTTDKRLAVAYILFKVIAALIALVSFPVVVRLLVRAERAIDGVTLLAAYHTVYNVVVLVLMPVIGWFTRFVERLLPDRTSSLTRCLDLAALTVPIAAAEEVRRTVACAVGSICVSVDTALTAASNGGAVQIEKSAASVTEAAEALGKTLKFMSGVSGPPEDKDEQRRITSRRARRRAACRGDTMRSLGRGRSRP